MIWLHLHTFLILYYNICTLPLSNCPDDGMLLGEKSQVIIQFPTLLLVNIARWNALQPTKMANSITPDLSLRVKGDTQVATYELRGFIVS